MKNKVVFFLLILSAVSCGSTSAAGDAKSGKELADYTCAACHGVKGISPTPVYPNLAGQKASYTAKQLLDFKSGKRKDPVMNAMAKALTNEDIENLSAFYAELMP